MWAILLVAILILLATALRRIEVFGEDWLVKIAQSLAMVERLALLPEFQHNSATTRWVA